MEGPSLRPVIVVLGPTGVGKTKLGVEISLAFGGEVVNADSMQVYEGLPIATNQPYAEEMRGIPHHLLGVVSPLRHDYNVAEYCRTALGVIADIHSRGRLPVIVGGSMFYIRALLLRDSLVSLDDDAFSEQIEDIPFAGSIDVRTPPAGVDIAPAAAGSCGAPAHPSDDVARAGDDVAPLHPDKDQFWGRLQAVDPSMAARLHPRDTRKILRSLEVFESTGRAHSDHIAGQRPELRFHVCLISLRCDQAILDTRLDARVEHMLERGLLEEISRLKAQLECERVDSNTTTKGVFQAIGYKELLGCLDDSSAESQSLCLEKLKRNTRHYSRKQRKWVDTLSGELEAPMYELDSSAPACWAEQVLGPALSMCRKHLYHAEPGGEDVTAFIRSSKGDEEGRRRRQTIRRCELCGGKVLMGDVQWSAHLRSRQHRRKRKKAARPSFVFV